MLSHSIDRNHGNHSENNPPWQTIVHLHIVDELCAPLGPSFSIFVSTSASSWPRPCQRRGNGFIPISPSTLASSKAAAHPVIDSRWYDSQLGWEPVARGYRVWRGGGSPHPRSCHRNREFSPSACRWQHCTPSQESSLAERWDGYEVRLWCLMKSRMWVWFHGLHAHPEFTLVPSGSCGYF